MGLKRALTITVDISDVIKELGNVAILAHPAEARRIMTDVLAEVIDSSTIGEMQGKAAGLGAMHGRAAAGLNYARLSDGVTITAGGVEWVAGSEFGGRIKIMTYQTRSRLGKPYTVTRHTTMQFNPWRGQKGYWMWPTITERMQGIREKLITALINSAVGKAS